MSPPTDAARVRIFPPAVPVLTIAAGIGLNRVWPLTFEAYVPEAPRYALGGALIAGAVLVLGLWSVLLFRSSGQNENPWRPTPAIVERGPYRITRNPMYLQMVLVCAGTGLALANAWILLLTPLCAWLLERLAIRPEEAYLEAKFGPAYLAYKSRVRRWL